MIIFSKLTQKELIKFKRHSIRHYSLILKEDSLVSDKEKAEKEAKKTISYHFSKYSNSNNSYIYKILLNNKMIGYIWYIVETDENTDEISAFLDYIYIYPNQRHKGYASEAIKKYETNVRKLGARMAWLTVLKNNKKAIDFYIKHSYFITEKLPQIKERYFMFKKLINF